MRWALSVLFSLLLAPLPDPVLGQVIQDPAALTAGQWEAVPLVRQTQSVPGSADSSFLRFKSIGMSRWATPINLNTPGFFTWDMTDDGMLVFWAGIERKKPGVAGPDAATAATLRDRSNVLELAKSVGGKVEGYDWALFSLKNGQLARICTDGVAVTLPGNAKGFIRRATSKIVALKDRVLIYYDSGKMFANYSGYVAWDGEKLSEFLRVDQKVATTAGELTAGGIFNLGRTEDGRVWVLLGAKGPEGNQWMYWVHDGTAFSPILSTRGKWPGTAFAAKFGYFLGRSFIFPSGMLLHGDGGDFGGSVVRIRDSQSEQVLTWKSLMSLLGTKYIEKNTLSGAADLDTFTCVAASKMKAFGDYFHASLVFCDKEPCRIVFDRERAGETPDKQFWINDGVFLGRSPVAYVFSAGSRWQEAASANFVRIVQASQLYAFDGATVKPLAKGRLVDPYSMRVLITPLGKVVSVESRDSYQLAVVKTGADGKKQIEPIGPADWSGIVYLGADGAAFVETPKFSLSGSTAELALTDVVGWLSEREAIALVESGIYRVKRID